MQNVPSPSSSLFSAKPGARRKALALGLIAALGLVLASCSDMIVQNRYDTYAPSSLWSDDRSARPIPTGVVQVGQPVAGNPVLSGKDANGNPVATIPIPVTLEMMQRGQEQFDIYCTPCHGYAGQGNGVAVQHGMPAPPSFHSQGVYNLADGQIFDIITNGTGRMFSYGYRIQPEDRWAIIAYLRALELSQNANPQILTPEERQKLESMP